LLGESSVLESAEVAVEGVVRALELRVDPLVLGVALGALGVEFGVGACDRLADKRLVSEQQGELGKEWRLRAQMMASIDEFAAQPEDGLRET
jgi:hypothetical protein